MLTFCGRRDCRQHLRDSNGHVRCAGWQDPGPVIYRQDYAQELKYTFIPGQPYIDRILSHYSDQFEMSLPVAAEPLSKIESFVSTAPDAEGKAGKEWISAI